MYSLNKKYDNVQTKPQKCHKWTENDDDSSSQMISHVCKTTPTLFFFNTCPEYPDEEMSAVMY